ncbi:MAG: type II toxin-antitoxin system prevent-host-death family antitoxin [Sphingobacteriia bacterium]|nr:type II toxin-antitoxin system prevent-host-death family antitoxin [Sphingobacteriia bacterium]
MAEFNATDAKNKFGELIDKARREPVNIIKNGRKVVTVISIEELEEMQAEIHRLREKLEEVMKNG